MLGEARKKTMPKGPPQEFVNVGKLNTRARRRPEDAGRPDRGEFFHDAQTFGVFEPGPDSPTGAGKVEEVATHEIAHGIFDPQLDAFIKATGYWRKRTSSQAEGRVEGPDGYAERTPEDWQSVMYFVDPSA